MKTRLLLFIPALTLGMFLNGCNAHSQNLPDKQIVTAFKAKYPNAKKQNGNPNKDFTLQNFIMTTLKVKLGSTIKENGH